MTAATWPDLIATHLEQRLSHEHGCVILLDSDNLLGSAVQSSLLSLGWRSVVADLDPLALRVLYEQHCREASSELTEDILLLLTGDNFIPHDIETNASVISVSLKELFPRLDSTILNNLPDEWYARLLSGQATLASLSPLSTAGTVRFVVRHCLPVVHSDRPQSLDYVYLLAELVRRNLRLSDSLREQLSRYFTGNLGPDYLIPDLSDAEQFISSVWRTYQSTFLTDSRIFEPADSRIAEAVHHLNHAQELQTQFTRLREVGILPAWQVGSDVSLPRWLRRDVHYYLDESSFLAQEIEKAAALIPSAGDSLSAWTEFAWTWARLRLAFYGSQHVDRETTAHFRTVHQTVEDVFSRWLLKNYPSLLQRPYLPDPIGVHHLLPFLTSGSSGQNFPTFALLVVDGMGLDHWTAIESIWSKQSLGWRVDNRTLLAVVPTLTSVSRQAMLSGQLPHHFADLWTTTNGERKLWEGFWLNRGIGAQELHYARNITASGRSVDDALARILEKSPKVGGVFIINDLDSMVHRSREPSLLLAQVQAWESRFGTVQKAVSILLDHFDQVVVTADHGHVEGTGIGEIPLGQVAEERALRARIFTRLQIESTTLGNDVIHWPSWGLPPDQSTIIPRGLGLFGSIGVPGIGHGGISLEEVFVPFAIVSRK